MPAFLRGRLRKSYSLVSEDLNGRKTRNSSYRMTFHQYFGVMGLGIGVSRGMRPEEILFLSPSNLEVLVDSIVGAKERKLPDVMLKHLRLEKREFVRDWMRGYVNLEKDDDEYTFSVDAQRSEEKNIWIEYLGVFDETGRYVGHRIGCGKCEDKVVTVPVARMDVVI